MRLPRALAALLVALALDACPGPEPSGGADASAGPKDGAVSGDAATAPADASFPDAGAPKDGSVVPRTNDAVVVASNFPTALKCGEARTATLTVKNTGTSTWTEASQHRLGAIGDSDPFVGAGRVLLGAGETVPPGAQKVFDLPLVAPATAGAYPSEWRMLRENVEWFGQPASFTISVTCGGTRAGKVRLQDRTAVDDGGAFTPLGATLMWAAWGYRSDRPRLEAALDTLRKNGFDYFRALGAVGDPNDPNDSWAQRLIDWRWADYDQVIAGLTDLAWDSYGLRVEWTLIGDGQKNIPSEADRYALVDRFVAMSKGREHKIMHFEIANEAWQNGFDGASGIAQLRALSKYLKDRTDLVVAASAPAARDCGGLTEMYGGDVADLATIHYDRDLGSENGAWGPVLQPWWPYELCAGFPLAVSNNEPVGPGSSVTTENDPVRLNAAAIATFASNNAFHVFHSGAGVRGFDALSSMAGIDAYKALKTVVPQDLVSWTRKAGTEADAPFRFYAVDSGGNLVADQYWPRVAGAQAGTVRFFGQVNGTRFFVFAFGILNRVPVEARRALDVDIVDPMTGAILLHKTLAAGERLDVTGKPALVLKGQYR